MNGLEPVTDPLLLKSLQNAPGDQMVLADPNTHQLLQAPTGDATADFLYGLRKPIDTGANYLARGLSAIAPDSMQPFAQGQLQATQQATQQAADAYKTASGGKPPEFSGPRMLGEMLSTAPLSMALPGAASASFFPRLLSNAAGGALSSVMTGEPNASPAEIGTNAAQGAGWGAAAAPLSGLIARAAQPDMSMPGSDVSKLMDIGVRPTIGQASGGAINRIEQAATSIPIVGDLIKNARQRSVMQFNRGAINDVLGPIGESLEASKLGRDAIAEMGEKVSNAYQRAVPSAGGQLDTQAQGELTQLRQLSQLMPSDRAAQFNGMLQKYVLDKISPNGSLTGESFKEAESDLGKAASDYLYNRNSSSDERQLGGALRQTQSVLRDWLARVNPGAADDIQAANSAYARMLRVENAAARQGEDPGVFSPAQFQAGVKAFATPRQYARGTALSQDLSDAGRSVLGATVPDSGTPLRHAVQLGLGALAGHGAGLDLPLSAKVGAAGLLGTAAAAYNPASQNIIAHLLASRYPWMGGIATGSRVMSPVAASGFAGEQGAGPYGLLGMIGAP